MIASNWRSTSAWRSFWLTRETVPPSSATRPPLAEPDPADVVHLYRGCISSFKGTMNIGSEQLDQALFALNDQHALRQGSVHLIVIGAAA
jgi:hypothetical protein